MKQLLSAGAALMLLGLGAVSPVSAQGGVVWGRPLLMSREIPDSRSAMIHADPFGRLHMFWEVNYRPFVQFPDVGGSVIYYSQFDGTNWSEPTDVLLTPGAYSSASQVTAASDRRGYLHAAYTTAGGPLFYSSAHIQAATRAREWTPPRRLADRTQMPYLVSGADGVLHLFYFDFGRGVALAYTVSHDGGVKWEEPRILWESGDSTTSMPTRWDDLMAYADPDGRVYVVWSDISASTIYFSGSADGGATWSDRVRLDIPDEGSRMAQPVWASIGVTSAGAIVVVWSASHDQVSCARYLRTSADGGATWTPRRRTLAPVEGCLHPSTMARDGSGTLHIAMVGRDAQGFHRLWHSVWGGQDFAPPATFTDISSKEDWSTSGPDRLKLAISQGNKLYAVWFTLDKRVWTIEGRGSGSAVASLPLPEAAREPTRLPSAPAAVPEATRRAVPTAPAAAGAIGSDAPAPPPAMPAIAGILPVIALLVFVVVARLRAHS